MHRINVDIVNSLAATVAPIKITQIEETFDAAKGQAQALTYDQKR